MSAKTEKAIADREKFTRSLQAPPKPVKAPKPAPKDPLHKADVTIEPA